MKTLAKLPRAFLLLLALACTALAVNPDQPVLLINRIAPVYGQTKTMLNGGLSFKNNADRVALATELGIAGGVTGVSSVNGQTGALTLALGGDMAKATYDANNDGKIDNVPLLNAANVFTAANYFGAGTFSGGLAVSGGALSAGTDGVHSLGPVVIEMPSMSSAIAFQITDVDENIALDVTGAHHLDLHTHRLLNVGTGGISFAGSGAADTRTALGATTIGASLFSLANPSAITFPRYNADNTVSALSASAFRTAIGAGTGAGDLLAANNLSDLANAATARTNLGGTTIGASLFTLANPGAITFPRYNADNTVSALTASAFRTAIGAGTGTGDLLAANNLSDLANAATARTNLGGTTIGTNVFTLANPSAITFPRYNADNTVSALAASAFRTAIGAGTGAGDLLAANNLSDLASATTGRTNLGLAIGTNVQAYNANLTTFAGIAPSANVQTLLGTASFAAFKASLSLDAVENTALSTWAGTANVVNLGTITGGTWHGSPLDVANYTSGILGTAHGGVGIDGSAAANGALNIGNGSGYTQTPLTAGAGMTITNGAGSITLSVNASTIVSGTLAVANGGTGLASYTIGDVLYASGATALSKLADVATGKVLISGGVGVAPSWGTLTAQTGLPLTTGVTGTLPVANGGTNLTSYAVGDLPYASGATALSKLADVAAGSYLRSGGVTTAPVWSTLVLPNASTGGDIVVGGSGSTNTLSTLASAANANKLLHSGATSGAPTWGSVSLADMTTSGHLIGTTGTPTAATGTGAGTGGSASVSGTDAGFLLTVSAGTTPAGSATIATVTFATGYGASPHCVFSAAGANSAALSTTSAVYADSTTTTFVLHSGTVGITGSQQYKWEVIVVQ